MRSKFLAIILIVTLSTLLNASEQIEAQAPMIVTIYTDKPAYSPGEDVHIKVEVRTINASRLSGANVDIGIFPPGGAAYGFIATETGIQIGDYFYTYNLDPGSESGIWTIEATVQKAGFLSGSDTITIQVGSE